MHEIVDDNVVGSANKPRWPPDVGDLGVLIKLTNLLHAPATEITLGDG